MESSRPSGQARDLSDRGLVLTVRTVGMNVCDKAWASEQLLTSKIKDDILEIAKLGMGMPISQAKPRAPGCDIPDCPTPLGRRQGAHVSLHPVPGFTEL